MKRKSCISKRRRSDLIFVCVMLAFPIAHFIVMYIGVNISSILLAFKKFDLYGDYVWSVGNFVDVFKQMKNDTTTLSGMINAVILWFGNTVISMPTGILVAYYFYKRYKFHNTIKTMLFIPSLISGIVTITVFYIIMDRAYPLLVEKLTGEAVLGIMVNPETQLGGIIFYNIFYGLAGNFLFYSSAMSTISEEISEAAVIDGATSIQELFHITLPMIYPMWSVMFIASLPGIFISDFGLYGFYKQTGASYINIIGFEFTVNMVERGSIVYPYYSAFGLILSVLTTIITFSAKALIDRMDPFANQDGSRKKRRRIKYHENKN